MARYVNIYREKNLVIAKSFDGEFSDFIYEHEYVAVIETDEGDIVFVPVMDEQYICGMTADELLKDMEDENLRIIMKYDCAMRDSLIKENITEWICNVDDSLAEAICQVVSLLTRHDMWKYEYAKCIDGERIKKEWDE